MRLAVVSFLLLLNTVSLSQASEHPMREADLPAQVRQALPSQTAGAKVLGYSQENEGGHIYYEIEMVQNGMRKDVLMDEDGSVVEIEQQVTLDSVPEEVRQALQQHAQPGTVTKVESVTKHGNLLGYEAEVKGGTRHEVQVDPKGKPAKF